MNNKFSQQLDTFWKYTKFIFKNIKAFRASRQLYDVRINLSLANMEIGKMTYHDPIYACRIKEFNELMIELVRGKWLMACAMEAKDRGDAKRFWEQAFASIRMSKEYSQRLLESLQTNSQEALNFPETVLRSGRYGNPFCRWCSSRAGNQSHRDFAGLRFRDGIPVRSATRSNLWEMDFGT